MTLPVSPNSISMSQVNTELGLTATATISLNDTAVRSLFGIASGTISLGDGLGKANISPATSIALSSIGQTSATVSWTASISPAVTYYTVYVTDSQSATVFTQTFSTLPLATSANITGLTANTPYTVHVVTGSASASVDTTVPLTTTSFDTAPNTFTFTAVTGATINTVVPSEIVMVSGLEPDFNISVGVTGGQYTAGTTSADADAATFTSTTATYLTDSSGNLYVKAQLTTSTSYNTAKTCTVTVGSGSAVFSVTTAAAITTPANFSFTPVTGAALNTATASTVVAADGMSPNIPITVSVTGGVYGAGTTSAAATSATFISSSGSYTTDANGILYVKARVTSSASYYTNATVTVTVGGGSAQFVVTTIGDTIPAAFTIPAITGAAVSTVTQSAVVTVTGLSPLYPVPVSISSGGSYDAADAAANLSGTFITTASNVTTDSSGRLYFQAQLTSSASNSTAVTTTITIGSGNAVFSVTTVADLIPNAFTFTPSTSSTFNPTKWTINSQTLYGATPIWSGVTTINGLTGSTSIPITWDNPGATIVYGTSASTVNNYISSTSQTGNATTNSSGATYLQIAVPAPAAFTDYSLTVTIGGVSATLTAKTAPIFPVDWTGLVADVSEAYRNTATYTPVITITGLTPGFNGWNGGYYIARTSGSGSYFASNSSTTTSGASLASYKSAASYIVPDSSGNIYIKLYQLSSTSGALSQTVSSSFALGFSSTVGIQSVTWNVTTLSSAVDVNIPLVDVSGLKQTQITSSVIKITLVNGASLPCYVSLDADSRDGYNAGTTGAVMRVSGTSSISGVTYQGIYNATTIAPRLFSVTADATGSIWVQYKAYTGLAQDAGNVFTYTMSVRSQATPASATASGSFTCTNTS